MSAVVEAVQDVVESVVETVGDLPQTIADTASHIVENVSDYVVNIVEDPTKIFTDPVQSVSDSLALFDDVFTQTVTAPISQVTSALDDAIVQPLTEPISDELVNLDDTVNEVIPGGWATVGQIALSFAAPGLGTALGNMMLGAGASTFAAATLGGAVMGAGTGALTASLRGGDPLKGALAGAAGGAFGGAVSHASMDIAASIIGGGDQIAGLLTLKEMSAATGISTTQLANVVSNSVASGVAGAATGKGDVATLIGTSLAASGIGAYAGSIVNGIDPGQLNSAVAAASSVATIGTRAALAGNDIGDAIMSQAPTLLANTVFAEVRPALSKKTDEITKSIASMWGEDTATKYGNLIVMGDSSDAEPGTKVTLADGSTGVVSKSGVIVPEAALPDTTSVVYKEPTGTVSIDGVVMEDANSPSGFSDSEGNPINKDGTPYLNPNEIDVAPDVEKTPEELYKFFINEGMDAERATLLSGFAPTTEPTIGPIGTEPTIGPPGPGPIGTEPSTWTPPPGAIKNSDGSYTVGYDDGSSISYDKDGNYIGSTDRIEVGPVPIDFNAPVTDPNAPVKDPSDFWNNPEQPPEEEPPAESTPEQKYNFYLGKGFSQALAFFKSGFSPKIPPIPVKPTTPAPVTPPVTTLPSTPTPTAPTPTPTTPTPPPVQYDNNWYMLASLLGAPDLAAQVYNKIPMKKGGLASLKPKKYGLASLTKQNRRSK